MYYIVLVIKRLAVNAAMNLVFFFGIAPPKKIISMYISSRVNTDTRSTGRDIKLNCLNFRQNFKVVTSVPLYDETFGHNTNMLDLFDLKRRRGEVGALMGMGARAIIRLVYFYSPPA